MNSRPEGEPEDAPDTSGRHPPHLQHKQSPWIYRTSRAMPICVQKPIWYNCIPPKNL